MSDFSLNIIDLYIKAQFFVVCAAIVVAILAIVYSLMKKDGRR